MTAAVADLRSHHDPPRRLRQHVAEILAACSAVLEQHGEAPFRAEGAPLTADLARLHDLGKGSAAFQRYIAAPDRFAGAPAEKAHTLLSLVLTVTHEADADAARLLALALAVRGHHGGQPGSEQALLGPLHDDAQNAVLCRQLPTLDPAALGHAAGLTLAPISEEPEVIVRRAKRTLRRALDAWRALPAPAMTRARFLARAAYSILLEADKAFLAVERADLAAYLHRTRADLPARLVDARLGAITQARATPMDALRERARAATLAGLAAHRDDPILTLTLPTGAGKTLLAARWALDERARADGAADTPTVILALPMLSIVDQTERVWRELLGAPDGDGETLLPFHSLSERTHDPELAEGSAEFFIDTWRSEVVVTTFDQILLALFSDGAKHALRYHRLLNARLVIDEVQCIPPVLWTALSEGLGALCTLGRTRVLAMSATPSPCLDDAAEVLAEPDGLYRDLARYELHLAHQQRLGFEDFAVDTVRRCREALARGEGTLVTVNQRATAQETRARLAAAGLAPLLLSGDLTPKHRLRVIDQIKEDPVRVVVSTQCVEAGVDLDMHHVIRDLAPLDALVQIAGRCNRHALRTEPGTVRVVHLQNPFRHTDDARDIYDEVLLQCTEEVLAGRPVVAEREVLDLCRTYFAKMAARKNWGGAEFRSWARIEEALDVRKMLRGEDRDQEQVLVLEQDPPLKGDLFAALRVADRWARRAALRKLSARLAQITVTVSRKVFPRLRTQPLGPAGVWNELLPGHYDPLHGIDSRPSP